MIEALELLGLRILSSIKLSNLLLENTVCDPTVNCHALKERGEIHLKIRKGLLPFPKKLLFKVPLHAIIQNEDMENVCFEKYDAKKGFLYSIGCSNLVSNQEAHSVKLQYTRVVTNNYISDYIEYIKRNLRDGKIMVTVTNNSDVKFVGYLVRCNLLIPSRLIQKRAIKIGTIKVYNNEGKEIENFIENPTEKWACDNYSSEMKSLYYGDVCWYIDYLNPHEIKIFKIDYSEDERDGNVQDEPT